MSKAPDADLIERFRARCTPLAPLPTDCVVRADALPHIRAVLFDIYGTLLVSQRPSPAAATSSIDPDTFRSALSAAGWDASKVPEDFDANAHASREQQASREAKRKAGIEEPEIDILDVWRGVLAEAFGVAPKKLDAAALSHFAVEIECRLNPIWPMPALKSALDGLRATGLKLGILSDAQFYSPLALEALLGQSLRQLGFDPSCCIYSFALEVAKPSARLYEEAMIALENEHAILCDEVLYVGSDLRSDLPAASTMGFRTALFAGDARSLRLPESTAEAGERAPPDRVVTSLSQLNDILKPAKKRDPTARIELDADLDGD